MKGPEGGYLLRWVTDMGLLEKLIVGSASPIVKLANSTQNEVVMAAGDGANGFREGLPCPTNDEALECSGNGACNCYNGLCACKAGWKGDECSVQDKEEPDNGIAPGAAAVLGVTLGSLAGVVLFAGGVWITRTYGCVKGEAGESNSLSSGGSGGGYGSSGATYDTRPLVREDAVGSVAEKSSLLGK